MYLTPPPGPPSGLVPRIGLSPVPYPVVIPGEIALLVLLPVPPQPRLLLTPLPRLPAARLGQIALGTGLLSLPDATEKMPADDTPVLSFLVIVIWVVHEGIIG